MSKEPIVRRVRTCSIGGEEHVMGGHVEGTLFAIGNPLLDISAEVTEEFLKRFNMKANDCVLERSNFDEIVSSMVKEFKVDYVPGGATQNTIRIAQWLIGVPNATTYMGCIGEDDFGRLLKQKVMEAGVNGCYKIDKEHRTGTCAVCLTGSNRSLVADLGAANHFTKDFLDIPENRALLEKAHYYYCAGFPLTVSPESLLEMAVHAAEADKLFCMNLSAPFLCSAFKEPMMKLLPYVDILFGNEQEALTFSKEHKFETQDIAAIALRIARLPKQNGKRGRIVVITQGSEDTLVIQEGQEYRFPVIPIDEKDIVDTNGAGDAFVGGFLAQLVQGGSLEDCIRSANYAANFIIQELGCQLPNKPNFSHDPVGF